MTLTGKVTTEIGIRSPGPKFYNIFTKQLHHVQNVAEKVHETKVHHGDWHSIGSVKQWTYDLGDGKVTCKEKIESIDEQNKTNIYIGYDGHISEHYKLFKVILQVIDKSDGGGTVIWTIEYEKINEDIEPPYNYINYFTKVTKDIDASLLKA